ncbi:hypothetical protein MPTK1_1g00600 [Marchantia polymorpha subsp. ruderalis]|uniref:Ureide permease n=2 Tax=Marchantia polymorpha TaxID=3197 RepID=A0AAF6AK02_MARPO|nr:hypothetical protein MARPO_0103s0027 [Marchantia polymorpha]BBM96772.1 hypothetical protein Mp_1g00600 [Marchantia polymorpha subsp. ruderalis]|eukprot:PTQ32056.1 hypothetical protein MARPO_0103s0027 [Marchantia polymorpha]
MYLVQDKGGAIALMLAALVFLGTWPAIMNFLEQRGRKLQHTYLDYSITNLLVAIVFALTFGQFGHSDDGQPNFLTQLGQDNGPSVAFALAGGLVLSVGNLACQYAWPFVGLSATEVISASITVVIGSTMNYFLDGRINRAEVLFPGVACFLIAVCLGSALHKSNDKDIKRKLQLALKEQGSTEELKTRPAVGAAEPSELESGVNVPTTETKTVIGSAEFLKQLEDKRAVKVGSANYLFGLSIVLVAGLCFSLFSPAFNLATNDQWNSLKPNVPHLVVYTAFFYFSIAAFVFGFGINLLFLYRPAMGLPKSSFPAYVADWNGRPWALLAGVLCGCGNGFQFMGGQAAGYAAADAVQALPLVSTFWGILIFGEYHRSSRKTYVLLVSMLVMFIAAVAILMSSSGHRKS